MSMGARGKHMPMAQITRFVRIYGMKKGHFRQIRVNLSEMTITTIQTFARVVFTASEGIQRPLNAANVGRRVFFSFP